MEDLIIVKSQGKIAKNKAFGNKIRLDIEIYPEGFVWKLGGNHRRQAVAGYLRKIIELAE